MKVGFDEEYDRVVYTKKLSEDAILPKRGSRDAAGYDLYAVLGIDALIIMPHETVKIGTGLAMQIPKGCFGGIFARSGLATKKGLRPANCLGVVDSDYAGEIIVALHNDSTAPQTISNHERIAQLIIMPFAQVNFEIVDELEETERGEGGFGSTGTN